MQRLVKVHISLISNQEWLKYLFLIIFIFNSLISQSQINLVPNGSFEDTVTCPSGQGDFSSVANWFEPNQSPDYFNACANWTTFAGVPHNMFNTNFQEAFHGSAYAGIILQNSSEVDGKEYIGVELSDTLKQDSTYCIRLYCVSADGTWLFTDAIQIALSDSLIVQGSTSYINIPFDYSADSIIDSDNEWTRVEFVYTADGSERFLYIGNFQPDSQTNTEVKPNGIFSGQDAYYFIDSVSVTPADKCPDWPDSLGSIDQNALIPDVFSPNGDQVNDYFEILHHPSSDWTCTIYNRWGKKVIELNEYNPRWNGTNINGELLTEGVYFYVYSAIESQQELRIIRKGTIQLFR